MFRIVNNQSRFHKKQFSKNIFYIINIKNINLEYFTTYKFNLIFKF